MKKYNRVLIKLSGEALMGEAAYGISDTVLDYVAAEIKELHDMGVEIGLVIGAGNIFRGMAGASKGMNRSTADSMGMLATVINSLALHDALGKKEIPAVVLSAIPMPVVCESYSQRQAMSYLQEGKTVIFAAGTSNPFFTTDTAAVLRSLEIEADLLCKATRVNGVYDCDPLQHENAIRFETLSFQEVLRRQLRVMDTAAISLAMDNKQPILVCDMNIPGNIRKAVCGENIGTLITGGEKQ